MTKTTSAQESTGKAIPPGAQPPRLRRLALILAAGLGVAQAWNEGVSTHFEGVGYPYGACGVPDSAVWNEAGIDTATGQANPFLYVALNVFDAPGDYRAPGDFGRRPLAGADTVHLGMYRNGANCGRWIRARWGDECDGANDGAAGQAFCRNGTGWSAEARNDAVVDLLVFDQCSDANAWCRDARHHLDIHTPALDAFEKPGVTLPRLATPVRDGAGRVVVDANNPLAVKYAVHGFNNRKVLWEFQRAPNYSGEPRFYFGQGSEKWYKRVIVTHLPNGLHGVEQWDGGIWRKATMEGDAGQMWVLPSPDVAPIRLRLVDADDQPVMAGRTWAMEFPSSCGSKCASAATPASNVRGEDGTVSVLSPESISVPRPGHVVARMKSGGIAISLPAGGQGRVEAFDLGGRLLARGPARAGMAWLPAQPAGIALLRWSIDGQTGCARVLAD